MAKPIYKCDGFKVSRERFFEEYVEALENSETFTNEFDELLDDTNDRIEILGIQFSRSSIVKEMDYSAYSMALSEHAEFRAKDDMDNAENWQENFRYDTLEIEFVDEDEDEEDE